MKQLYIIGAGGCGREVLQWAKDINEEECRWTIKGFLDDDLNALQGKKCDVPLVSRTADHVIGADDVFVCAIGNSAVRQRITEQFRAKGAEFVNIIHPTAVIADSCCLGEGVIVYPFALISDNARVADGCIVNMYSSVAHDSVVGRFSTICAHCDVTGMCRLGERVFMGTTAQIIPGTQIGDDVYICAGSTVMTRARSNAKLMGNPARLVTF